MYKNNSKLLKRSLYITLFIFVIQNGFSFYKDYQAHVTNAPEHLKEANKDYIIAKIFANYNAFFIKTFRIETDNFFLFPFREPMLYFYKKGLEKLSKDEPIRAMWFNEFQLMMYNYSNDGEYGKLAKNYDYVYAKRFINEVYQNIELLNKGKERLNEYYKLGYKNELTTTLLQTYIHYIHLYVNDYHLNVKGYPLTKDNLEKVSTYLDLYEKFLNIDVWTEEFISYFNKNNLQEYDYILDPSRGWYSDYRDYNLDSLKIASYILFYEIRNNRFDCEKSKKYLEKIIKVKKDLREFVDKYSLSIANKKLLEKIISYLDIKGLSDVDEGITNNPLNIEVNCHK